jgi:glycosyltransferase involved in cell wall biosynthesis
MKKAIVSVTNDLYTDQRVNKVCLFLHDLGFEVTLVGRKLPDSKPIEGRPYRIKRMKLWFRKGALFYAEYNFRLFLYLLFAKADVLVANDLDTLLANASANKFKMTKLVYDSHEYFTEVPELVNRPRVQKIWKTIERKIFPGLKYVITVNESIAEMYNKEYGVDVKVVRNIPLKREVAVQKTRTELGLPEDKKIVILQGAWINVDRGGEEAVEAMQYLENTLLIIVGGGDVIDTLKSNTAKLDLIGKVKFFDKMPYDQLCQYTANSDLGLTLDKDTNINYRFSLPNKLFDYIHAGIPVLASDLVEIKRVVETHKIGIITENHDPKHIAEKIESVLSNPVLAAELKQNTIAAREALNWENESEVLRGIYADFL